MVTTYNVNFNSMLRVSLKLIKKLKKDFYYFSNIILEINIKDI